MQAVQAERRAQGGDRLRQILVARRKPLGIADDQLQIVVVEADAAEGERECDEDPDEAAGQVRPQQRREHHRHQDETAAHGGRTGFLQMRLRTVGAHALADLVAGERGDHARADEHRHGERRHRGENAPQREVLKHVEAGMAPREIFGEIEQHGVSSPASWGRNSPPRR